jgi:hypothetical protein
MKVQATIATVQYLGSFILALLNDLFLTHMWSQMCDQVDNGSKGLLAQLQGWSLMSKAWFGLIKTKVVWLTSMVL